MNKLQSAWSVLLRVAAVSLALCALGCLVSKAQKEANPEPAPPAETPPADAGVEVQSLEEVTVEPAPTFLPSSKFVAIPPEQPAVDRTMMFSSKSGPPPRVFLPSSKSRPLITPQQRDQAQR